VKLELKNQGDEITAEQKKKGELVLKNRGKQFRTSIVSGEMPIVTRRRQVAVTL